MKAATREIPVGHSRRIMKFPNRYVPQVLQGGSWRDANPDESVSIFNDSMLPYFASHDDGPVMYFHGLFDIAGEQISKHDGRLSVSTGYPSGGCRSDPAPSAGWSARTLERGAAVLMIEQGDLVMGWTYHGWRAGYFIDRTSDGNYRFSSVEGEEVVVSQIEAKRYERHERCMARLLDSGEWVDAIYYDFINGEHRVRLADTFELVTATRLDWSNSRRNRVSTDAA